MGDRATIRITDQNDVVFANVYTHWMGSQAGELIEEFLQREELSSRDNRFADPPYLAARFIEFMCEKSGNNGMGVGLLPADERMGYCDWQIKCDTSFDIFSGKEPKRPVVTRDQELE